MLKDFREFIARGNVIDLAVAVVIGAAFGKIVTTFAEGMLSTIPLKATRCAFCRSAV